MRKRKDFSVGMLLPFLFLLMLLTGCGGKSGEEYSETQFLLDTVCTVRAGGGGAENAVRSAFARIREISQAVDCYSQESVVSAFNRAVAGETVELDVHTAAVLEGALAVSRASGGAFDVTVAPVQKLWPFQGQPDAEPPAEAAVVEKLSLVGYENLVFDAERGTLTKLRDGVEIDLGGAAKGYAADQAVQVLREAGVSYALLDLGGNVAVFGENPKRKDGSWQVGIQKPFASAGEYSRVLSVKSGAVVTSGTYQRGFDYRGRRFHHILNPDTGFPADTGLFGVTVTADSALLADCLSTGCLVLGEEKGRRLAEQFGAEIYFEKE